MEGTKLCSNVTTKYGIIVRKFPTNFNANGKGVNEIGTCSELASIFDSTDQAHISHVFPGGTYQDHINHAYSVAFWPCFQTIDHTISSVNQKMRLQGQHSAAQSISYSDGLMQKGSISIVNALELYLFCIKTTNSGKKLYWWGSNRGHFY